MLILRSVLILTLALSSLFSVSPVSSAGRGEIVDRLKAVFVCKFPKYVTWRDSAPKGEFRIAVVGKCGVERYLQELSTADIWGPRAVRVARYEDVGKVGWCHILFVASSVRKDLPRVLAKAKKEGILTVGDTKGYATEGVAINFIETRERLRFEINRTAVEQAGLGISSELLKLATRVIVEEPTHVAP